MDISSLLSPQDSPAVSPSPPAPRKLPLAHTAPPNTKSPLSQSHTPSPITPTAEAPPTFRRPALPAQRSRSHTSNPTAAAAGPTHSPLGRHASTSGMDTLADLAAMQHAQPATAGGLPNPTSTAATSPPPHPAGGGPPHPTAVRPSLQEISRAHSGSQSSVNISLGEVPTQTPQPRTFTSATLSAEELAVVSELAEHLAAHPHAYAAHAQLVETLFDGLVRHAAGGGDPRAYDLLPDLRQAVDAMASRYALGEELWLTRLAMQRLLATNLDDGSALVEMLEKAVDEEAGSAKIWAFYGDFVAALHDAARDDAPDDAPLAERPLPSRFSDEDRLVGVEVFGREQVLAVFKRAADATKWHLSESHKLWDRYTALILQDLGTSPGPDAVAALKAHYVERLQTPHAQWENTFQQFSTLISTHDNSNYEAEMVSVKKQTADAREKYAAREMYEVKLAAAAQSDRASEWAVATQYLEWELANRKKKTFSHPLLTALFQRVLHRFPAAADTWTELLLFLGEDAEPPPPSARPTSTSSSRPPSLLPTLDRATAHCPWSGALWALYIQTAEREDLPFPDIGQVKHKATSTGLLDHGDGAAGGDGAGGGVAEALAVHAAWAGYLRRRAFRPGATDEERDVAEVGLRSALEDATTLGARQQPGPEQQSAHAANGHGAAANGVVYRGDPEYRLERTYIKFLDQSRHVGAARDTWRGLVGRHGDGYAFWLRFYEWEMRTWARLEGAAAAAATTASDASGAAGTSFPRDATNVLQQAARRLQLDWPEKILETYQRHCEDHEDVATLQAATRLVRRRAKEVARRREKEAVMAAEEAATAMQASRPQPVQQQQQEVEAEGAGEAMEDVTMTEGGAKRKRDDATNGDAGQAAKRSRASREEGGRKSEDRKTQAEPVRDREHTMVIVRNLPWDANEKRVRHLFHDCGSIKSIGITVETGTTSATATIEFDNKDDVLTAKTKDLKSFDGREIRVESGAGSTLYVTNYPPKADKEYMHDLFGKHGEIVDIRFPSHSVNARRRFAYIQFRSFAEAQAASAALDGTSADEEGKLKLVAKLSNPDHKAKRSDQGATAKRQAGIHEGREVYVSNVDWSAEEKEVKEVFEKYGAVERVRIPRGREGKSKGMAFVVFKQKEDAEASLDLDKTKLKSRILHVEMATSNPHKK